IRDLDIFAARWLKCIVWTKNLPLDPTFPDSDYPGYQAPLAYDSRARLFVSLLTEHPEITYGTPVPSEPEFSSRRLEYAKKVLVFSGFNDFRAWIDQLRELLKVPILSESITVDSRSLRLRKFIGASTGRRAGITLSTKRYHVDWLVTIDLNIQPQTPPYDYARNL